MIRTYQRGTVRFLCLGAVPTTRDTGFHLQSVSYRRLIYLWQRDLQLGDESDWPRWLRQAKAGDRIAFSKMVEQLDRRLVIFCKKQLPAKLDHEAIAQETWIKGWKKLSTFDGESEQFLAWLFTVARNLGLSQVRRPTNQQQQFAEDYQVELPVDHTEAAIETEYLVALRECMEASGHFREVMRLRYVDGLSYQEIAELLKMKVETVGSKLFKGRDAVKECIERKLR